MSNSYQYSNAQESCSSLYLEFDVLQWWHPTRASKCLKLVSNSIHFHVVIAFPTRSLQFLSALHHSRSLDYGNHLRLRSKESPSQAWFRYKRGQAFRPAQLSCWPWAPDSTRMTNSLNCCHKCADCKQSDCNLQHHPWHSFVMKSS